MVYRSVGNGAAVAIDSTFQTRFKDQGLAYELEYTYRVTAINGGGESAPSNAISGQPLNRVIVTTSLTSGEVSDMPLTSDTTAVFTGRIKEGRLVALEPGQVYYWKVVASTHAEGLENSVSRVESFKVAE